jgi:hypothetical protein
MYGSIGPDTSPSLSNIGFALNAIPPFPGPILEEFAAARHG